MILIIKLAIYDEIFDSIINSECDKKGTINICSIQPFLKICNQTIKIYIIFFISLK